MIHKTFSLLALLCLTLPAQGADPLFEQMAGDWQGSGTRVQLASKSVTQIEMRTRSQVEPDRLVTQNEVRETNDKGEVKTYARRYWIRAVAPGRYELGVDANKVFSRATFEENVLVVIQNVAGYLVRSETRFTSPGESVYEETLFSGERPLALTKIQFRALY